MSLSLELNSSLYLLICSFKDLIFEFFLSTASFKLEIFFSKFLFIASLDKIDSLSEEELNDEIEKIKELQQKDNLEMGDFGLNGIDENIDNLTLIVGIADVSIFEAGNPIHDLGLGVARVVAMVIMALLQEGVVREPV